MKSDFERVQQIEKRITAACDWAVKQGYVLISGDWSAGPKGYCALTSMVAECGDTRHPKDFAISELNMTGSDVDAFVNGWDGVAEFFPTYSESQSMLVRLGEKLRAKYEPMLDRDYRHR